MSTFLRINSNMTSHAEDVVLPNGKIVRPWHREAGGMVKINGGTGMSHFPSVSSGPIRKYGLGISSTDQA